eukprot:gene10766-1956_t
MPQRKAKGGSSKSASQQSSPPQSPEQRVREVGTLFERFFNPDPEVRATTESAIHDALKKKDTLM